MGLHGFLLFPFQFLALKRIYWERRDGTGVIASYSVVTGFDCQSVDGL